MKILIIPYKFGTSKEIGKHLGLYDYFRQEFLSLKSKGHNVTILAPWLSWLQKGTTQVDDLRVQRYFPTMFSRKKILWLYKLLNNFYIKRTIKIATKTIKEEKPNVVYVIQGREVGYAISQVINNLEHANYANLPKFVFRQITTWAWHFEKRDLPDTDRQINFAQNVYTQFDKVVFLSQALKEEAVNLGLPESKATIVPLAVDIKVLKPIPKDRTFENSWQTQDKKVILYVGRVNFDEKGVDYLIRAFSNVKKEIHNARLVLAGPVRDDCSPKLEKLIKSLNLEQDVLITGKYRRQDLPNMYSVADVSVTPSVWLEAFGIVSIEAMACGTPLISTNVGGLSGINIDNETGLMIEPKDELQLSRAIIRILQNPELKTRLSKGARQRVKDTYSFESVTNQLIQVFSN